MSKWFLPTIIVLLSLSISIVLLDNTNAFLDNRQFIINRIFDNVVSVVQGNFIDKHNQNYIIFSSHDTKMKIRLFENKDNIKSIKYSPIEKKNIIKDRFWMHDMDNDSLMEIYFFYTDNDSLFVIRLLPKAMFKGDDYLTRFFIDRTDYKNSNLNHRVYGIEIDASDFNNDGYKELIILYGTRFSHPRGIAVFDIRNNLILKRIPSACMPHHISYYDNQYIISYRGPHNGVELSEEMDNACKIEIRDSSMTLLYDTIFIGYSFLSTSIDTSSSNIHMLMFSHFNPDRFPAQFVTLNMPKREVTCIKVLPQMQTFGFQIFVNSKRRGKLAGMQDNSLTIIGENGEIIRKIAMNTGNTPNTNNLCCSGIYYIPQINENLIFSHTDRSYLYNLDGELVLTAEEYFSSFENDFFKKNESTTGHSYSYSLLEYNDKYYKNTIFVFIAIFILFFLTITGIIITLRYLWIAEMYRFLSISSENPAFILVGKKILSMNKAGSRLLVKHDIHHILRETHYRKKTFILDNEYYQIEFLPRNILGIKFKAVIMENLTRDIEIAQFKALFDKIALLNHNIKNSMTSLLARKEIILLQESDIPQYILDFFEMVNNKAEEINDISRNVMNLAIGDVSMNNTPVNEISKFIEKKYTADIRLHCDHVREFHTDWKLLKYILENIIDNAVYEIRNIDAGYVDISIESNNTDITIEIFNNGPTIDNDTIDRIMRGGYSTKPHGSGYGVYVSKSILSRMDSELIMQSCQNGMKTIITLRNAATGRQ